LAADYSLLDMMPEVLQHAVILSEAKDLNPLDKHKVSSLRSE
jgi:hypothetical protein